MQIEDALPNVNVALLPHLEVRFVHENSGSEAFVRRRDRSDADGYVLRLKSWDDVRVSRDLVESNLIRRVLGAFGPGERRTLRN